MSGSCAKSGRRTQRRSGDNRRHALDDLRSCAAPARRRASLRRLLPRPDPRRDDGRRPDPARGLDASTAATARRASSSVPRRSAWRSVRRGGAAWSTSSACVARSRRRSSSSRPSGCVAPHLSYEAAHRRRRSSPGCSSCRSSPSAGSRCRSSSRSRTRRPAFSLDSVAVELTFMLSPGGRGAAGHAGVDVGRAHGRRGADGRRRRAAHVGEPADPERALDRARRRRARRSSGCSAPRSSSCSWRGSRRRSCWSGPTCRSSRRSTTPAARPTSAG